MKKLLNLLFIAALIVSCTKNADEPVFKPTELTRIADFNKAAFSYFNGANSSAAGKSFVISPINISTLLGMEANVGTDGGYTTYLNNYGFGTVKESNEFYNKLLTATPIRETASLLLLTTLYSTTPPWRPATQT